MAADRIVNIKVTTTSQWQAPSTLYANVNWVQTGLTGFGNQNNRLLPGGGGCTINLQGMPRDSAFTNNVRIQLTLDDHMTDYQNRPVHSRWAVAGEGSNPPAKAEGPCMFMLNCGDANAINPLNVSFDRVSPNLIRIQDNRVIGQPDNVQYAFGLGMIVELPTGNYFITLDPASSPKGTGTSPIEDEEEGCEDE